MTELLKLFGAKNKETGDYATPFVATKDCEWLCPDCGHDLILKKGEVKRHHFCHKNQLTKCRYYSNPTESQIHKEGKMLLKMILDSNIQISILRTCPFDYRCKESHFEIPERTKTSSVIIEYRYKSENTHRIADVALLIEDYEPLVFEIYHTHKTNEKNRDDEWFEIEASQLIEQMETIDIYNTESIILQCIRNVNCDICNVKHIHEMEKLKEQDEIRRQRLQKQIDDDRIRNEEDRKRRAVMIQKYTEEANERAKRRRHTKYDPNSPIIKLDSQKWNEIHFITGEITDEYINAVRKNVCKEMDINFKYDGSQIRQFVNLDRDNSIISLFYG
jgi:ssDNA-binding Zn-finger/Zn-ribbon topoisomerase 1/ferredoxin